MKNTEVIEVSKAFFRTEKGMAALDAYEEWKAENHEVSSVDERLSKLSKSSNKATDIADHIREVLKGEGVALTGEQIVAKINANLRKQGSGEIATIGQVNGWLRLQGIRSDKKPKGEFQKDDAGKVSYIDQPVEEEASTAQEDLANLGKSKTTKKKESANA